MLPLSLTDLQSTNATVKQSHVLFERYYHHIVGYLKYPKYFPCFNDEQKRRKITQLKGLLTLRESEGESETFLSIFVTTLKILKAQFKVTFQDRFVSVWISAKGAIALNKRAFKLNEIQSHIYRPQTKFGAR